MDLEERRHFDSLYPEHKFERRAFIVTSIGAGFALAVQPISAQTITTDSNGLIAGPVKVPVKDGEMPAYRAMPDKEGPFPMILVVHEAWAVHESRSRRLRGRPTPRSSQSSGSASAAASYGSTPRATTRSRPGSHSTVSSADASHLITRALSTSRRI